MSLSTYHKKYSELSDEQIAMRLQVKETELQAILNVVKYSPRNDLIRIAVMGCGDKRLVKGHKQLFQKYLKWQVTIITFDITTEHLNGEENVIQHDCTLPIPGDPFDITYAHVLLKFIETEKQWNVLKNSYDVLSPGGFAMHILDKEEYLSKEPTLPNGLFAVPLERWKQHLHDENITYLEIPIKYGKALVLLK